MPRNPHLATLAVNAEADAVAVLLANGFLRIFDGAQPADGDAAITAQVLLAELRFGNPAFGAPVAGVATANAITPDSAANATGTAAWFRCVQSDGLTPVMDGSAGTSDADLILDSVAVVTGGPVSITALTYTARKSA